MAACNYYGTSGTSINNAYVAPSTSGLFNITYDINWYNVMFNLLPSMYRPFKDGNVLKRLKLYRLFQVAISQLIQFYKFTFLKDRSDYIYLMRVTNQTIVLEKYLRDRFNDCSIYITNNYQGIDIAYLYRDTEFGNIGDKQYWFRKGESNPNQTYLLERSEAAPKKDFTLHIPQYLITNNITSLVELNSILSQYVNVCNTWDIATF